MIDDKTLKEWADQVNENNDLPGKRYDWNGDFKFTDSVVNDLRDRGLLEMGAQIQVLVPVNRENAPTYYHRGEGVIDADGKRYDGEEAEPHDYEPYDILHINLSFNHKDKSIGIDRYYGHRADWTTEGHTGTHRDWTDIPPISKATVSSIMEFYKDRGVTAGLLNAIDEYVNRRVKDDVETYGKAPNPWFNRNYDRMDDFEKSDKRELYRKNSNDPRFLKWLQRYIEKYRNDPHAKSIGTLCEKIESGEIFSYTYNFFEPERPTEEYIKAKAEDHRKAEEAVSAALRDYYDNSSYTGD